MPLDDPAGPRPEIHPETALLALYESRGTGRTPVTYGFLGLCLLVTLPSLFFPGLYQVFGGIEPREHWWQPFTAAFEHGWPGVPGAIHLGLNAILILEGGRPTERLLGSRRFLALGLLSLLVNALAISLTEGVNGSSLVIWSWGPSLFVALAWARRRSGRVSATPSYARLRGLLVLMYGVISLLMGFLPYLSGWRGNPLVALYLGNRYHLVAAGVGIVAALFSRGYLRARLDRLGETGSS